ncbi:hypothetical protein [Streptomyces sp. NPDC057552]|uniref:hypothetical protein n=1 Tax=Streptomyces sp. NPDC057552 TaxID=3350537 RepID=UPI0036CC2964
MSAGKPDPAGPGAPQPGLLLAAGLAVHGGDVQRGGAGPGGQDLGDRGERALDPYGAAGSAQAQHEELLGSGLAEAPYVHPGPAGAGGDRGEALQLRPRARQQDLVEHRARRRPP